MTTTTTPPELPLTGKGVEVVHIPALDQLATDYAAARDRRLAELTKEIAAKTKLVEGLKANESDLMQPDGTLAYRFGDMCVTLWRGKDKVKVEDLTKIIDD
jgi:hypothetical protein